MTKDAGVNVISYRRWKLLEIFRPAASTCSCPWVECWFPPSINTVRLLRGLLLTESCIQLEQNLPCWHVLYSYQFKQSFNSQETQASWGKPFVSFDHQSCSFVKFCSFQKVKPVWILLKWFLFSLFWLKWKLKTFQDKQKIFKSPSINIHAVTV